MRTHLLLVVALTNAKSELEYKFKYSNLRFIHQG